MICYNINTMNKEISKQEALKFLKEKVLAVVSTVSPTGKLESATVMYFVDDEFNFYFVTRLNTRKSDNLRTNSNIAVVVGTELAPVTVQIEGTAELINNEGGKILMDEIAKRPQIQGLYFGPFLRLEGVNFGAYKVKINWLRWLSIDPETGEENYSQII